MRRTLSNRHEICYAVLCHTSGKHMAQYLYLGVGIHFLKGLAEEEVLDQLLWCEKKGIEKKVYGPLKAFFSRRLVLSDSDPSNKFDRLAERKQTN